MRKTCERLFLIIIFLIIIIPIKNINNEYNSVSNIDNARLPDFPIIRLSNDFLNDLEIYLNFRIGYRAEAINIFTSIHDKVFNEMIHPNYDYGEDGYIFPKITRQSNDFQFLDLFVETLSKMQKYCNDRQITFVYCIEPSKSTVLREYLPDGVNHNMERYNYLISLLELNNINYVNNLDVLLEKSKSEMVFNKKFDAAHWNDLGELYGTNEILKNLCVFIPELTEVKLDDYEFSMVEKDKLLNSNFAINEYVPNITPIVVNEKIIKYDKEIYTVPNYKDFSYYSNSKLEKNSVHALMFQGSYFIRNPLIISNAFDEFVGIHNYENIVNLDYYYNIFKPDCIIFETAEYTTTDKYFTPQNLKNAIFTPSFTLFEDFEEVKESKLLNVLVDRGDTITTYTLSGMEEEKTEYYLNMNKEIYNFRKQNGNYVLSIKNENINVDDLQITKVDLNTKFKIVYNNVVLID